MKRYGNAGRRTCQQSGRQGALVSVLRNTTHELDSCVSQNIYLPTVNGREIFDLTRLRGHNCVREDLERFSPQLVNFRFIAE